MNFRKATPSDIPMIEEIYSQARAYMRENGNLNQWVNGYPDRAIIQQDIAGGNCHICEENGEYLGVFSLFQGPDPTYFKIFDGSWRNDKPYVVIHRIAVTAHRKGVASRCFDFALEQCPNLRIDTHLDNIPMQRSLEKNGFIRCGIIYLANGDPRIAYHKVK
ncbi:MAG: GNAT family N-acetyltransferase [Oscillospiraceae bacterium]|nr:GNAT family N-acetyltransferase [Oscillospiraceae bacterium]